MRNMERDETGEVGGGQTVNVPISHVFFFFFLILNFTII